MAMGLSARDTQRLKAYEMNVGKAQTSTSTSSHSPHAIRCTLDDFTLRSCSTEPLSRNEILKPTNHLTR